MKKIFLPLAVAALTLSFNACEDVPAPYEVNGGTGEQGGIQNGIILNEAFTQSLGEFNALNTQGEFPWTCSFGCAQVTSYADVDGDGKKENNKADSWLISPKMDLSKVESANISFDYILRYANASELATNYLLLISKDYAGIPANATWTTLDFNKVQSSDWDTWYNSGKINVPAEFLKQPAVTVALRYIADKKAATWEVKNFKVEVGEGDYKPGGDEQGGQGGQVEGKNILTNSDFEAWTGETPDAWTSTTTASSATLSKGTEAHGGKMAVLVAGNEKQNKRLASKEYTLKPGTYNMSLFVKGAGQVRPGYAIVNADGTIPSQGGYVYGDYTATDANSWTEVKYSFKLTEQTKVNFVMMNPKTSSYAATSDKLVDDFTVTTADGGLVAEGEGGGTTQPEVTGDILNETFANGQGNFTIENKILTGGMDHIWSADTKYGYMKASAYFGGVSNESESWLISPVVDLTKAANPTLTFSHVANKGDVSKMAEQNMLFVKEEGGQWIQMTINKYPSGSSWKDWTETTQDLSAFKGKKMQFAFVYKTPQGSSGTWEIKNVVVK